MTIEKITPFAYGVFAMLIIAGEAKEMTFETEKEAIGYVAAMNAMFA